MNLSAAQPLDTQNQPLMMEVMQAELILAMLLSITLAAAARWRLRLRLALRP